MRWAALAMVALLAPMAAGHPGHTGPESDAPGAWAPPSAAANATENRTAANASAPGPLPGDPTLRAFEPSVASPATREWLGYKGDALRTGSTLARLPESPAKRWDASGTVGVPILGSPVVAHGLVVFGSLDRHVYAVDAATGFPQWKVAFSAMVFASPSVVDDRVIVVAGDGTVAALELASGGEVWKVSLRGPASAAPLVFSGVVFVASEQGRVLALDAASGKEKWNRTLPAVGSTVAPLWMNGRVLIGDKQGTLHALHALTGQTLWTARVGAPVTATPVGAGRYVIVPTLGLQAVDVDTGRVVWNRPAGAFVHSSPAYANGMLAYGNPDEPGLAGANALTGEMVWAAPTRLYVRTAPVIAGAYAVAASEDGTVLAVALRNGSLLWALDAGERVHAPVVVLDGRVFAARTDGVLRLFADAAAPPLREEAAPPQATKGNGVLGLLPVFALLAAPYAGLRWLRRMARARPAEAAPEAPAAPPPRAAGAPRAARLACPRCACRFGAEMRHLSVVTCPGCGLRSVMRLTRRRLV